MFNKVFNKEFNRESKLTKITALVKNLLTQNSRCLESLKSLKGLIENPWEISHFKNEIDLQGLIKFLDVPDCQDITLSLLGKCCVEEGFCSFVAESYIISKLVEILSNSQDTYTKKCVVRVLSLMYLHESCFKVFIRTRGVGKVLVAIMCEDGLDEEFLHEHLKTIKLLGKVIYRDEILHQDVTCILSALLKRPLSHCLAEEILQLIYYFLKRKTYYDCGSLLKILVGIAKAKGKLSDKVLKFILDQLLPIRELGFYIRDSGVLDLLVDNFKSSQCYKEKQKLLHYMIILVSNKFESKFDMFNEGYEMLVECLNDPLFRSSYPTILNILSAFINFRSEDITIKLDFPVSFCFNIIEERNFFNLSEITSILLDAKRKELLEEDGDDKEQNPNGSLVENSSVRSDINIKKIPVERKKLNLEDYIEKRIQKYQTPKEKKLLNSALRFLSEITRLKELDQHFESPQRIRILINAIATSPTNRNLHNIFSRLINNPQCLKAFLSEMFFPILDLFTKMYPYRKCLRLIFSKVEASFHRKNHFSEQPKIKCILSFCHTIKDLSGHHYFGNGEKMAELVSCMYDNQQPLRLLAITSYCRLFSSVENSCECEVDECDIEEKEELAEKDYDVSFVVGQECVRSVRSRLMQHSDVFSAMFNGVYSEASSAHVVVTDTSPQAFRVFNNTILSGRFKCELYENYNCDLMLQVLQLANKYLVRRLEWQMVRLVRSNLPAYLDAILASNFLIASRPLLICCLLKVCKNISCPSSIIPFSPHTFQQFTTIFNFLSQQEFTDISTKLIKSLCIHQV